MHALRSNTVRLVVVGAAACGLIVACSSSNRDTGRNQASKIERGRYLAAIGGCNDCHTPKVMTASGPVLDTTRLLAGHTAGTAVPPVLVSPLRPDGWAIVATSDLTAWAGPWGASFAANLTPDRTGMEGWTADQFIDGMRTGKHMGVGRPILPPMPWQNLDALTDDDLRALFAYLQSIKPVSNTVPPPAPPAPPGPSR